MNNAIILISCPDQKGITASVTGFIFEHGGNIIHADQHIDEQNNVFFMRVEFALDDFDIEQDKISEAFESLAERFNMDWELYITGKPLRGAIFVSKPLHCLYDLLFRQISGQLNCEFPLIVSNHTTAQALANQFGVGFHHIPKSAENKQKKEKEELALLRKEQIDFIVLARYHQILSKDFIDHYPNKIINIHHSFLPAFAGKQPYEKAYEKGVKLIGATSHYVTEDLDQGPIIEQDTVRISHRDSVEDLKGKGQDLERLVLYRALRWHLERKVLSYNNKTVIFA